MRRNPARSFPRRYERTNDATVRVKTQAGQVLDSVRFDGVNRAFSTAAYANDWATVLRAQGLRVLVQLPDGAQAHAPAEA